MIETTSAAELIDALRTVVRLGRGTRPATHPSDIASAAASLLSLLDREGEQRLGQLACRLAVDPSVVSRQVAALTLAGLADRRPDPVDGRALLLAITEQGRAALDRHNAERIAWLARALDDWRDEDVRALAAGLRRLERAAARAYAVPQAAPSPVG